MITPQFHGETVPDRGPTQAGLFATLSNGGEVGSAGSGVRELPAPSPDSIDFISEPARRIPVLADVDVLVCGGGPAGTAAAIAAARSGARTLLVEHYGFLGGMATAGLVVPHFSPHHNRGINSEMITELERSASWGADFWKISFDPERWKHVSEEMVLASGSDLLFHTTVVAALTDGDRVRGAVVQNKSGRFAIRAQVTIDATGDGDLAARAGAHFDMGRESDGLMQSMTTMFRLGGVNWVQRGPSQLWDLVQAGIDATGSPYRLPFDRPWSIHLPNKDQMAVQLTHIRGVDGTNVRDLTRAEIEGRRQARTIFEFLRDNVPEFRESNLIDTAAQVGVRETRRIVGDYTLTKEDVMSGQFFEDGIASVSFPMDIHESDGLQQTVSQVTANVRGAYDIPYRSMLPADLEGVLVAGRAISGTYEAHASYRVKGPCMAMGQAAGTAAAIAVARDVTPRQVPVDKLQTALREQGVKLWPRETRRLSRDGERDEFGPARKRRTTAYQGPG